VFDHIRRAAAWTRRQLLPPRKNRHRLGSVTSPTDAVASTPGLPTSRPLRYPKHGEPIRAEDNALVRPYVLTHEERRRLWCASPRRAVLIRPYFEMPEVG
jgi:hypothetical protein